MGTVDCDFMTAIDIYECVKQLKIKNCEGYDRIPQRIYKLLLIMNAVFVFGNLSFE